MQCIHCGEDITEGLRVCEACEKSLHASQQAVQPAVEYAGFWLRLGAYLIDGLLLMAVGFLVGLVSEKLLNSLSFVFAFVYFVLLEASEAQATIGKRVLGLIVTDMNGQRISFGTATVRFLSKILSGIILLIGYIMVAFTDKKQGLHDKLAGTLVVKKVK